MLIMVIFGHFEFDQVENFQPSLPETAFFYSDGLAISFPILHILESIMGNSRPYLI